MQTVAIPLSHPRSPTQGRWSLSRREIGWIVIREVRYGEKEERELGEIHRCIVLIKEWMGDWKVDWSADALYERVYESVWNLQ